VEIEQTQPAEIAEVLSESALLEVVSDGLPGISPTFGPGSDARQPNSEITGNAAAGSASSFVKNALLSVLRLLISTAIGLLLPGFLIRRLGANYSAWVLVLQMSAYVSYLDFGIQTGISKYVAEYQARNDDDGSSVRASAGFALMLIASLLGVVLTLILAWRVPHLFREMPSSLYRDVRISLVFVGVSLSFALLSSIFGAIFLGLQRYGISVGLSLVNRVLYTIVMLIAVGTRQSLAVMGALVAAVNVFTGFLNVLAWRRMASHVRISLRRIDRGVMRQMLGYCSTLAIWSAGMLCVTGFDVTIVGHYDYNQTKFYSIATLPTNFLIAIIGAALSPLMPTTSALSVNNTPKQMGALLTRTTRYSSILLMLASLPLMVGGYWVLRVVVGSDNAMQTMGYMRILLLANVIRNMCLPYASMLVATESQRVAIAGATAEAVVNLTASIVLARHIGAIGVAYGTLLGSFVSVGMHFALSMHYTQRKFAVTRLRLFLDGLARPSIIAVPSLLIVSLWWTHHAPSIPLGGWALLIAVSAALAWWLTLGPLERRRLVTFAASRVGLASRYNQASVPR
jgi:O-antigen/teichoic acid export membrane protein